MHQFTEQEKKQIYRRFAARVLLFAAFKVTVAVVLNRWARSVRTKEMRNA